MAKSKKKIRHSRPRNFVVEIMILHCKAGGHINQKKEKDRKACRNFCLNDALNL